MQQKPALSKRKAKRLIKVQDNEVEAIVAPETKMPVKRKTKFYLFIAVMLILNGFTYAYWLTDIFDDAPQTQNTQAKNLPQPNKKTRSVELPPDWDLPPQNAPIDRGYNASSGQFPPGALPSGVTLPGISGMNSTMPGRTMAQGYGATDNIRQNFTGQIRDSESNLLYYGARYYNPQHGRFTSVDPENYGADPEDSQSWNAYAYARNNPLKYTDPDGLEYLICNREGKCWTHNDDQVLKAKKAGDVSFVGYRNPKNGLDSGVILDNEGNELGTYQQTSHDSQIQQMLWGAKPTLDIWQPVIEAIQPVPIPGGGMVGGILKIGKAAKFTSQVLKGLTKATAKQALENLAISPAAKQAAKKAIQRASASNSTIEIITTSTEQVVVKVSRPGRNGYQVIETIVNKDGTKTVIQKAYDAGGRLVHYDPK